MKIRWKNVAVVLPLLVVTTVLVNVSAVFSATTGITRIAQNFLDFKAGELQKHAEGQWALLVENQFTNRPEMVEATRLGVLSFARSLKRTDTEIIFAFDSSGAIVQSSIEFEPTPEELPELSRIYRDRDTTLMTLTLAGEERIVKGFFFPPFDWFYMVSESRDTFYRDVDRIVRESAIILAGALLISVLLLLYFSGQLTRPIAAIVAGMREIILKSDMSARVPVQFNDETGELAHTFNIMIQELDKAYTQIKNYAYQAVLAQKKEAKIRNIFQKYVPQDLIDKFFQNPESMLVGENRELSVLFSDIRSFTSISEAMRPDELVNSLNRYFSVMVDLIMNRGGIIDKYIGDAIMAFFGAPVKHSDDALQSVIAGLEMSEQVKDFNREQIAAGRPEFKIGIGINYGEVTVGNIGTDRKMDYTVIGDMVNLASRLEGLTKPYGQELILAETLLPAIDNVYPWRLLDSVAVKGKQQGVKIYTCSRRLTVVERRAWKLHNEAMEHYYKQRFDDAIDRFRHVKEVLPGDVCAGMLEERCHRLKGESLPANWDGVEVMKTK